MLYHIIVLPRTPLPNPLSSSLKNNFVVFCAYVCLFACCNVYFILFLFTRNSVLLFFHVKPP